MDPYTRRSRREIYANPWLSVEVHAMVHPTGIEGEHLLIVTPAAAAVLVEDDGDFIFAEQPRFGARAVVLEIVKGGADTGEPPESTARRELREELGLEAAEWTPLGAAWEIPSIVDHPVTMFLARNVASAEADQEAVERIEAVRVPVAEAFAAAAAGRIDDAVTLAALLRYRLLGFG